MKEVISALFTHKTTTSYFVGISYGSTVWVFSEQRSSWKCEASLSCHIFSSCGWPGGRGAVGFPLCVAATTYSEGSHSGTRLLQAAIPFGTNVEAVKERGRRWCSSGVLLRNVWFGSFLISKTHGKRRHFVL